MQRGYVPSIVDRDRHRESDQAPRGSVRRTRPVLLTVAVLAGAAGLVGLLVAARGAVDVLQEPPPPPSQEPVTLRLFDNAEIQADPEFRQLSIDLVTAMLIVAIAAVSLFAYALLRRHPAPASPPRLPSFFLLSGLGALGLWSDEILGLHETAGYNLPFLEDLPGVNHADDVLFALYPLAGLAFVVAFRSILAGSRTALALFALALVTGCVAAALDVASPSNREEPLEVVTVLLLLIAFATLAVKHVLGALTERRLPDDAEEPPGRGEAAPLERSRGVA